MKHFFTCSGHASSSDALVQKHRKGGVAGCGRWLIMLLCVLCVQLPALAQNITVNGVVSDSEGEPLIGASVQIKGTNNGVTTNIDGEYSIVTPSNSTLVVSYVGYETQEIAVNGRTTINFVMSDNADVLDEVVVVGYGTMKRSDLTGAVSSVDTKKLNAKGAPTILENLQGSTPGVNITKSTGRANGGFDVEIRGRSSIESSTTPLFVVDGVQCSDIDFLNPQDIERIDVLKDASSTAIYGSRATAGVIIVTTKGGTHVSRENKASITYDGYYGINHAARMPNFMTGEEFYRYRLLKFTQPINTVGNAGNPGSAQPAYGFGTATLLGQALLQQTAADFSSPFLLKEMLANDQTYFWPGLVTRDGNQQNHYVSVSGASDTASYHFGVGLNKEDGIYVGDSQQTFSFKGSVDARINSVISAGFNINLARMDNDYACDDAIGQAYRVNPFMIPYDENGNVNHFPGNKTTLGTDANQFSDFISPLDRMKNQTHKRRTYRALGNIYLQLDIVKGLNVKTVFAPSYTNYRDGNFTGYINPETGKTWTDGEPETSSATVTNYTGFGWTWDNTINFNRTFNDIHSVNLMGLFSMEKSNSETYKMVSSGVMENTDWWNMGSGELSSDSSSSYGEGSMISYALRANYGFMDKYLLTATIRWDGSSKFAQGHRWGSFPSAALAWRINQEDFMRNLHWISNLKLRLSYGVTGNNKGVGNYATIQGIGGPIYYPFGPAYSQGFYPAGIVDVDLTWEKSHEWNVGIDYGFLNNRIYGSIEYYHKQSKDLLYGAELPLEAGGVKMKTNIGKVRNEGVEVALTTINLQKRDFEWSTTFTFSHNKNEVLEINGEADRVLSGTSNNLFVGQPYHTVYTYAWDGVISDRMMTVPDHDIARDKGFTPGQQVRECDYYWTCYGLTEGQAIIRDVNGDGQWTADDKVIYNADPKWTGSLTSNFSYTLPKKYGMIDFSFNIYAKQGQTLYSPFLSGDAFDYHDRGRGKIMMDYYIPAGQMIDCDGIREDGTLINPVYQTTTHYGSYPMVNCGTNDGLGPNLSYYQEARGLCDASFVKVKSITFGYTFDRTILSHIGCKQARLYFNILNPFVFTKYQGFDPEWANAAGKNDGPSVVSYQIGASIKF